MWLTRRQAEEAYQLCKTTLLKYAKDGTITALKVGSVWRFVPPEENRKEKQK